jgi:hypothetical protein
VFLGNSVSAYLIRIVSDTRTRIRIRAGLGGGVEEAVDPVTGTTLATARGGGWLASIGRTVMRERVIVLFLKVEDGGWFVG